MKFPKPKPKHSPKENESPKPSPKESPKPSPKESPKHSPKSSKHEEKPTMSSSEDTPTMSPGGAGGVEPSPPEGGVPAPAPKPTDGNGEKQNGEKQNGEKDKQNGEKETKPAPKASKLVNAMAVAAGYAATPESAAHRNNNPIAQPSESKETKPPTATGTADGMCTFATSDDGIRAAEAFVKDLISGKIPPYTPDYTIAEVGTTYFPPDPEKWAKTLAKELSKDDKGEDTGKVTPDTKLSELPQ